MDFVIDSDHSFDASKVSDKEQTHISFSNDLPYEEVQKVIDSVYDIEEKFFEEHSAQLSVFLNLKNLDSTVIRKVLEKAMLRETLVDINSIININLMINGYSSFDDGIYESPNIFAQTTEQFIDLKLDLTDSIRKLQHKLVYWYLACMRSIHKVEFTSLDTPVKVPQLYVQLMSTNTLINMSQIFSKVDDIALAELPVVEGAYCIVASLIGYGAINNELLNMFPQFVESLPQT